MSELIQYAKLGSIEFSPTNGFNTFSKKESSNYAEHQLLNSKNKLQPTGENLKEISGTMRLIAHARGHTNEDFTQIVNVEQRLIMLRLYRANNTAVEFVWGNGNSEGTYVITEVEETVLKQFPDGTKILVDVAIKLKEYFEPDPLKNEQANNRKNAPAVGDKKSNAVNSNTNIKTCPQLITDKASQLNMYAAAINKLSIEYGIAYNPLTNTNITKHLLKLKAVSNNFAMAYADPQSCIYGNEAIKNSSIDVEGECDNFIHVIKTYSVPDVPINVPLENFKLQYTVSVLKSDLLPLIQTSITRNG